MEALGGSKRTAFVAILLRGMTKAVTCVESAHMAMTEVFILVQFDAMYVLK
jgi:hypothetical protein